MILNQLLIFLLYNLSCFIFTVVEMSDSLCKTVSQPNEDDGPLTLKATKVQFVLRTSSKLRHILLECFPKETILAVKERLGAVIGTDPAFLRLVFCGQSLADETQLSALELGPTTSLNLLLTPSLTLSSSIGHPSLNRPIGCAPEYDAGDEEGWVELSADQLAEKTNGFSVESTFSAFFVFCKSCASLKRAKLRAYCRMCESSAIIFRQEPQKWEDVKENSSIRVFCHHCELERGVLFSFKCVKCDESASPLQHISRNSSLPLSECVICGSNCFSLGIHLLGCTHFSCVQCFIAYAQELLSRMSLKWHPQVGYTVGCPVYGCTAVVTDVHTLYLLGMTSYQHYQKMAAQLFFSAQIAERKHCPWPNCGAAFLVEETTQKEIKKTTEEAVLCPECCRLFCRRCCSTTNSGEVKTCKCAMPQGPTDVESASLIRKTTKNCPHCAAPTERNGGCAHIRCTQCKSEWCFVCLKLWSDDCQWDHWFE